MAQDDYGVVVGIQSYPALDTDHQLLGPERDAKAFYNWLVSPTGGDVPPGNVTLIVSSYYTPPFASRSSAKPIAQDVQDAFDNLQDIATDNNKKKKGLRTGRRLYIYFAGHGFSPRPDQTALLMANAAFEKVGPLYHILGQYTADWFFRTAYFDEIMLFMDCCRETVSVSGLNMSWTDQDVPDAAKNVKRFYGQATQWSGVAREKVIDGDRRGVFTVTLMRGLEGAASNPTGEITAASLSSYLYNNMKELLDAEDIADGAPEEPQVDFYPKNGGDGFLITKVAPPTFPVSITVPDNALGKTGMVFGGDFSVVESIAEVPKVWEVNLHRGKYLAQIQGTGLQEPFDVNGTGGVNVTLK